MPPDDCPTPAELAAFHAGDLPPADIDRVAAHLEGCPACEAALAALDGQTGGLADAVRDAQELPPTEVTRVRPQTVSLAAEGAGSVVGGRYTLRKHLGEGGMGTVWLAHQTAPVRRAVAVKLVKAGMDTFQVLARFEAERQALAVMDHPNIARVFDAGATDAGRPFFVMELVAGVPITEYCDARKLTPRERLALFVPVCQAVQHAHQKGVIHRDLKPGNILVALYDGRPVPKVIDFGIAKATGPAVTGATQLTGLGVVVGTPAYMAPEQAELNQLDIDTRADIYALGVVLYELLTGSPPLTRQRLHAAAVLEMLRLVREDDPPPPSSRLSTADALPSLAASRNTEPRRLAALLRGELDWVVMKCLEKDRGRRYDTANGLARDIERYLADEPVEAGKPSRGYRLRRTLRRNRRPLALAAVLAAVLTTATAVSSWQAVVADRAKREAVESAAATAVALDAATAAQARAESEASDREAVQEFFQDTVFAAARPKGQEGGLGREVTLRQAVDAAVPQVAARFAGRPVVEAAVRAALGETYFYLSEPVLGIKQCEVAARLNEAHLPPGHAATLAVLGNLAAAYDAAGRTADALKLGEKILAVRRENAGADDPLTCIAMGNLAVAYLRAGRANEAVALSEESYSRTRSREGPATHNTLVAEGILAVAYQHAGRLAEAIELKAAAQARTVEQFGADDTNALAGAAGLAQMYLEAGRVPEAARLAEATAVRMAVVLGEDSANTVINKLTLSEAYARSGRPAAAVRLAAEGLASAEAKLPPNHPVAMAARLKLSAANFAAGRPGVGRKVAADLVHRQRTLGLPDSPALAAALIKVGEVLLRYRQYVDAGQRFSESLVIRGKSDPRGWPAAEARTLLGEAHLGQREYAAAEAALTQGYAGLASEGVKLPPSARRRPADAADALARLYRAWGKPADAAKWSAVRAEYPAEVAPLPRAVN